jgi:hypothetical protein
MLDTYESNTSSCLSKSCSEVYITKSNFERIANKKRLEVEPCDFEDLYDSSLGFIFSVPELRGLYIYREFLKNPNLFIHALEKSNNQTGMDWVWEGASGPAFHCNKDCMRLHSDYINVEIPPEITDRGCHEVEKYRAFVGANTALLENDDRLFLKKLEAQFFLKNPPKTIKGTNSGTTNVKNFDLIELKNSIEKILRDAVSFKSKDEETSKIIRDKGYGTNRVKEAKVSGHPLFVWHKYKVELKRLLKGYYSSKYNREFKFKSSILGQLGFKPCVCCKK